MTVYWLFLLSLAFKPAFSDVPFEYTAYEAIYKGANYGPIMKLTNTVVKDGDSIGFTCYMVEGNQNWLLFKLYGTDNFINFVITDVDEESCPNDSGINDCNKLSGSFSITQERAGRYQCSAMQQDPDHRNFSAVVYWYTESIGTKDYMFENKTIGAPVNLSCTLTLLPMYDEGIKRFVVTWEHKVRQASNDVWLKTTSESGYSPNVPSEGSSEYTLTITDFTPWRDGGVFRCEVRVEGMTDAFLSAPFNVAANPLVLLTNSKNRRQFKFAYDEVIVVTCTADAFPVPENIYFELNGVKVQHDDLKHIDVVADLLVLPATVVMTISLVDNVTESLLNNKTLSCVAKSGDGTLSSQSKSITINHEPIIDPGDNGSKLPSESSRFGRYVVSRYLSQADGFYTADKLREDTKAQLAPWIVAVHIAGRMMAAGHKQDGTN